jgi:hypothetical protein
MRKIKVNTESLISALFLLGYDKVDALLYTLVLGATRIAYNKLDKTKMYELDFMVDDTLSRVFDNCIKSNPITMVELKDGYSMNTDVSKYCNLKDGTITFGEYISNDNNTLLAFFIKNNVNMEEVVCTKVCRLGINNISNFSSMFSEKEKNIVEEKMSIVMDNQKKKIKAY